jgi:hypothetical protein
VNSALEPERGRLIAEHAQILAAGGGLMEAQERDLALAITLAPDLLT